MKVDGVCNISVCCNVGLYFYNLHVTSQDGKAFMLFSNHCMSKAWVKPFLLFNDLVNILRALCYLPGKALLLKSMLGLTAQAVLKRLQRTKKCVSGGMMREAPVFRLHTKLTALCDSSHTKVRWKTGKPVWLRTAYTHVIEVDMKKKQWSNNCFRQTSSPYSQVILLSNFWIIFKVTFT